MSGRDDVFVGLLACPRVSCIHVNMEEELAVYELSDCYVGVKGTPEGARVAYFPVGSEVPVKAGIRAGVSFKDACTEVVLLVEAFGPVESGYAGFPLLPRL